MILEVWGGKNERIKGLEFEDVLFFCFLLWFQTKLASMKAEKKTCMYVKRSPFSLHPTTKRSWKSNNRELWRNEKKLTSLCKTASITKAVYRGAEHKRRIIIRTREVEDAWPLRGPMNHSYRTFLDLAWRNIFHIILRHLQRWKP